MSHKKIAKLTGMVVLLFGLILMMMSGCSKGNSNSTIDPDTGKHVTADWRTAHQATDPNSATDCAGCHRNGANSPLGTPSPAAPAGSAVDCFNNTLCHAEGGHANDAPGWANGDVHGAAAKLARGTSKQGFSGCQICHGANFMGSGSAVTCRSEVCHGVTVSLPTHSAAPHPASPWRTSGGMTHTDTDSSLETATVCYVCHEAGNNLYSRPATSNLAPGTPDCFNNTLCHATPNPHTADTSWGLPAHHGAAAKSAPTSTEGFSYCQSCHGANFAGGTTTTSCLTACHTNAAPHAFPWLPTSTYKHDATNEGNALVCALCHLDEYTNGGPGPRTYAGTYATLPNGLTLPGGCFDSRLCHPTGTMGCINCHNSVKNSPIAAGLGGPATRRDIVTEMKNTWSHKRSSAGGVPANTVVTSEDCIVCHMEGDRTTGTTTAVHKDGYVDLRDPDTGLHIKNVTWDGATPGAYVEGSTDLRFVQFGRDLGVKLESDPNWLVVAAIQQNHCLKCHDTGGAINANAQVATGGTALKPFGTTIAHVANTIMNNAIGSVYDVKSNFLTSNASYHPVMGRQNNSYADIDTMTAPYNQAAKTSGTLTGWGDLISCWDCHAPNGASGAQTMTVTAHGGAATLRAPAFAGGATAALNLCLNCHQAANYPLTTNHGASSAFTLGKSNMSATTMASCHNCHSNYQYVAATNRPIRAEDVHGFNARTPLTADSKWASGSKPYAFWRTTRINNWGPKSGTGDTITPAMVSTCNDTAGGGTGSCGGNMSATGNVGTGGTY